MQARLNTVCLTTSRHMQQYEAECACYAAAYSCTSDLNQGVTMASFVQLLAFHDTHSSFTGLQL